MSEDDVDYGIMELLGEIPASSRKRSKVSSNPTLASDDLDDFDDGRNNNTNVVGGGEDDYDDVPSRHRSRKSREPGSSRNKRAVHVDDDDEEEDDDAELAYAAANAANDDYSTAARKSSSSSSRRRTSGARHAADGDGDEESDPWGADLMGDDSDRERLMSMNELEREAILTERDERRKGMREHRMLQERLRQSGIKPDEDESSKPRRSDRERDVTAKSKKRQLETLKDDKRRKTERRSRHHDASGSDDEYRDESDRRSRDRAARKRRRDDPNGLSDLDADEDDLDDYGGKLSRKDTAGRDRDRSRRYGSYSPRQRSRSRSPADGRRRHGATRAASPPPPPKLITSAELRGMMLTRREIAEWCYTEFFEEVARDAFVRVNLGAKGNQTVYRVCQIVDIREFKRAYELEGMRTNKSFILKHGAAEREFLADVFSNSPFTEGEYHRWTGTCAAEHVPLPLPADATYKRSQILKARAFVPTVEDLHEIRMRRETAVGAPRNPIIEQTNLRRELEIATSSGNRARAAQLREQLDEVERELTAKFNMAAGAGALSADALARAAQAQAAKRSARVAPAAPVSTTTLSFDNLAGHGLGKLLPDTGLATTDDKNGDDDGEDVNLEALLASGPKFSIF
ncbi:hypothetical protein BC828DRAFT_227461 [Blastocladiella britannica]|nr:hypothetical protein BC828DRAFT_227461 [Blastocladiella britannica]